MAVEPEQFYNPFAVGGVKVLRVVRGASGAWSVEFELNFRIKVDDTRDVVVSDRHVMVRGVQRGRKAIVAVDHEGQPVHALETGAACDPYTAAYRDCVDHLNAAPSECICPKCGLRHGVRQTDPPTF